jgi:hypothetical protein
MFKQILVGGSLCAGLLLVALPSLAQTSAPTRQTPSGQTPSNQSPANQSPAPQSGSGTTPASTPVSQDEIQKFASAIKQLQSIQQDAQQQASRILEGEQLTPERYGQILQSQQGTQSPSQGQGQGQGQAQTQPSQQVSPQERQKFERANSKLDELRQSTRQRFDQVFQTAQLPRERFEQILTQVRQDPSLRQRIEQQLQQ